MYAPSTPELAAFGPFTSKDVDFYGFRKAAGDLADQLDGKLFLPELEDETPNSAVVVAEIDGHRVTVDFLRNILGVSPQYQDRRCVIVVELSEPDPKTNRSEFEIPVMHPVNCVISRVNSILHPAINRRDEFAVRQLCASYYVFREFIRDMLERGRTKEVHNSLSQLSYFLFADPRGTITHLSTPVDFLGALREVAEMDGMHPVYREKTLIRMILRIEGRRARRHLFGSSQPSIAEFTSIPPIGSQ